MLFSLPRTSTQTGTDSTPTGIEPARKNASCEYCPKTCPFAIANQHVTKELVPRTGIEPARAARFVNTAPGRAGSRIPTKQYPEIWCLEPESNRHAPFLEAADFKSAVSTNFTIEANGHCRRVEKRKPRQRWVGGAAVSFGGATRSRTGLNGFAGRGITALLSRHIPQKYI